MLLHTLFEIYIMLKQDSLSTECNGDFVLDSKT